MDTPASSDTPSSATNGSRPHLQLLLLFVEQIIGHDPYASVALDGGHERRGPGDRSSPRPIRVAVHRCDLAGKIRPALRTHRPQQSPKPLDARGLERHATEHHLSVQIFQKARVRPLQRFEWHGAERLVCLPDGGKRLTRAALVVEQCVVEIEQDRLNHR